MTHFGPDEIIDWLDDVEFRRFAHRTGLTNKLVSAGFIRLLSRTSRLAPTTECWAQGGLPPTPGGCREGGANQSGHRQPLARPGQSQECHAITEAEMANIKTHLILTRLISDP
jgi:hypothetical protein